MVTGGDYRSYIDARTTVGRAWGEPERWTRAVDPQRGAHSVGSFRSRDPPNLS